MKNETRLLTQTMQKRADKIMPCHAAAGHRTLKLMAMRLAQRIGRRKRSHQVGEAEMIIPINHETVEIVSQQKKLFREQFGREPGPDGPLFFDPGVAVPQFLSDESTVFKVTNCDSRRHSARAAEKIPSTKSPSLR
jgi:hypothetical protein